MAKETNYLQFTIEWAVELGVEIAKDLEDKKLTLAEGIALWDNALRIPKLVKGMKYIPEEWEKNKDSEEYTAEIISAVSRKLQGLPEGVAQELVLQAIKTGMEIGKFVHLCVDARKK